MDRQRRDPCQGQRLAEAWPRRGSGLRQRHPARRGRGRHARQPRRRLGDSADRGDIPRKFLPYVRGPEPPDFQRALRALHQAIAGSFGRRLALVAMRGADAGQGRPHTAVQPFVGRRLERHLLRIAGTCLRLQPQRRPLRDAGTLAAAQFPGAPFRQPAADRGTDVRSGRYARHLAAHLRRILRANTSS